jgi:hypothetical protein
MQGLEDTKLSDGQGRGQNSVDAGGHGLGSALKLDESVEGVDFFVCAAVACSHGGIL